MLMVELTEFNRNFKIKERCHAPNFGLNDNDEKTYVKTERVYSLNTALKSGTNDNPKQLLY